MVLGSTGEEDWTFVMLEKANKIVLLLDYIVDERGHLGLFPSTLFWLTGKTVLIRKTVYFLREVGIQLIRQKWA